jgi:colanic acid/amylovoran biosynthesis glycosyltransferase
MDTIELDDRPVALIFRSPLFNASEGFVQAQAAGLVRYQPVVLGLEHKGHVIAPLRHRLLMPESRLSRWRMACGDMTPVLHRVASLHPKVIHAHFGPDGLRALPLARALGLPLITGLRGYDVHLHKSALIASGRWSWIAYALGEARLQRHGALFLAVSDALRRRALARGFPEDRTLTHYNGVDLDRFRPGSGAARERIVLHVGRLVEKKGTLTLIRAFAAIAAAQSDARLEIYGDGPLRPQLEREAATLGLGERIAFCGHASADMVARRMRSAWLLAVPSCTAVNGDGEGLPNVVVEAAASGLPVIGTDHAGIPEAVGHGQTGLLVPEGDVGSLAEALKRLLGDAEMQAAFGRSARQLAEERFDASSQARRLEQLYDELSLAYAPSGSNSPSDQSSCAAAIQMRSPAA